MQGRGFSPDEANRAFAEFVRSGEEDVLLEIILSTYQEMLESEIGRCIHEDRIIEQRLRQQYRGPLARNIQCLMEYLFTFPSSPSPCQRELGELPIKLWNRYLPDYFDEVLKQLFHIPTVRLTWPSPASPGPSGIPHRGVAPPLATGSSGSSPP